MPQAISYVRFSSIRQYSSNSVERQQLLIAEWLTKNPDYTLSDLKFQDLAKSGYHGEHVKEGGGFRKLLGAIEAGAIKAGDVVLVEAIDRTGRLDTVGMLAILTPILEAGVSLITLDDGNVYNRESCNGSHIYLLVGKIQTANQQSARLSHLTSLSYKLRRTKALEGTQVKRWTPVWLTTDGVVIDRIAKHVKTAFELYTAGVGKATIGVRMRETGEPELATCSGPTVEGWLRNKTAVGYWNDIPNAYPSIIEPELFLLAQQRGKEAKTTRPAKTAKHFLVGLVKCGHCGGNYIMQNKDRRPYSMRCLNRQRLKDSGCDNTRTIPKPVLDYVRVNTSLGAIEAAFQRQQLTVNQKRILTIQDEREGIGQRITALIKLVDGAGELEEIMVEIKALKATRDALDAEIVILERTESPVDTFSAMHVEDNLLESDTVKLAALLKSVDYRINVFADGRLTVNWPGEENSIWAYKGVERATGYYLLRNYEANPAPEPEGQDNPLGLKWKPLDETIKIHPKPYLATERKKLEDMDQQNPLLVALARANRQQP